MNRPALWLSIGIAAVALALAGWHWRAAWWPGAAASVAVPTAPAPSAAASTASALPPAAPVAAAASGPPPIRHPIEAVDVASASAPAATPAPATLESALANLFAGEFMATLVRSDDFARRVVVTVDNLGREKVAARLWPLQPPAGRFTARRQGEGGAEIVASDNFVRYARHLVLVEKTDLRQAVALYKRHYPQFQQAHEELGYPGRHFNDRVVEVIDLMLATPAATEPLGVRLPALTGPVQPERPWVLYEFADPAQQALPAGQQLLLRMGPDNARRVKARLAELRGLLARP